MRLTTRLNWTKVEAQKKQKCIFETALIRNQESGDDRKPQLLRLSHAKLFSGGIN